MTSHDKHTVIAAQELSLGYNAHPIVSGITLHIQSGEFIGILGPNGSGKSTFLRSLLGLIKPLAGQITVLGSTPTRGHEKVGYIPQLRSNISIAHLTSRALIETSCNGTRMGIPLLSKTQKHEIQRVLKWVKAESYADRPFQQLSGGERQRVFLAQALLGNPQILILDEPLANLDPYYQEEFINLLRNIQIELKATILFTAHDANPLLDVMDRVLYFARGKAAIGPVDEVITSDTLSALYETAIEVILYKQRLFVLGEGRRIHGQESHHA